MGTSNRLLPHQFAPGNTADFTRVEQALRKVVDLFNEVPPSVVERRWSHSSLVWGYSPGNEAAPLSLPWLRYQNSSTALAALEPPQLEDITNPQRVKSCGVPTIFPNNSSQDLFTWEVAWSFERPTIIAALTLSAQYDASVGSPYDNNWVVGAGPNPVEDFTLQLCVDDAWDLENRRKLKQEALVYNFRADAFDFNPVGGVPLADIILPQMPTALQWDGKQIDLAPLVLVPAGGRVRVQFTIPLYSAPATTSWGTYPFAGNVWNFCAQVWEANQ